ncbi:MAG: hypothetical protein ACK4E0_02005 [Chitinophagaceae bacterium]
MPAGKLKRELDFPWLALQGRAQNKGSFMLAIVGVGYEKINLFNDLDVLNNIKINFYMWFGFFV